MIVLVKKLSCSKNISYNLNKLALADANEKRDWRTDADFAHVLIRMARELYAKDDFGLELEQTTYALDSMTINLCLSLFPWARFRKRKGAVKLHTLMDFARQYFLFYLYYRRSNTLRYNYVTIIDKLILESVGFYIMDQGYIDFGRLYRFTQNVAFFVTHAKKNLDYSRRSYRHIDPSTGLRSDQTILLKGPKTSQIHPDPLRQISYFDLERHIFWGIKCKTALKTCIGEKNFRSNNIFSPVP
jgi:hypothetical protein